MKEMMIYGNPQAAVIICRLVGEHEKEQIAKEVQQLIEQSQVKDFGVVSIPIKDWFYEMSPWKTNEKLFDDAPVGGAAEKLEEIMKQIAEFESQYPNGDREYILAGYSLAGLFALWTSYQTDKFSRIVATSPSVWYPDWIAYIESHACKADKVYLSLGSKEHKTRNVLMAKVADNIKIQQKSLIIQNIETVYEINAGNHFKDVTIRMLKGLVWSVEKL